MERYSDKKRVALIKHPFFVKEPNAPKFKGDTSLPHDDEIESYVTSRRNKSVPGPDGISFVVFKSCKSIRSFMCSLVRDITAMDCIPNTERLAIKILIPKSNSNKRDEYRDITLFNTLRNIVMGVWSKRVRDFMIKNKCCDTTIQKGFLTKISGCLDHNQTLLDLARESISAKEDVHLLWLDLQNAFGSVKHNLIRAALECYNIPPSLVNLVNNMYECCYFIVQTNDWETKAIQVEIGTL